MNKGNLPKTFIIPSTGVEIKIAPKSMTSEMMIATDSNPPPKPPLIDVNIAGIPSQERNGADPNYIEAYKNWDNLLQFEVMKRILYDITLLQDMTAERRDWCQDYRLAMAGLSALPKSDQILWFFKQAIGTDQDMQAVARACARLADPQEDRISEKSAGF